MKKPTAILCGDSHLRSDQPLCRNDDFFEVQLYKTKWLRKLQQKYNCPVLSSGDTFHKWKPDLYLLQLIIKYLPECFITIPGNHDLPSHNLDLFDKCGLNILEVAGIATVLFDKKYDLKNNINIWPFPWGIKPTPISSSISGINVALCHTMTYARRKPWPDCKDLGATSLLKQMKGFDLVVVGHNHKSFVVEHEGRLLVNPGSLSRQTADQADHKPRIYLWYAEDNHVEPVFVPIKENVINRSHINHQNEREERISAFVSRIKRDAEVSLSFVDNIHQALAQNRIRTGVKKLVLEAIDDP